MSVTAWRIVKHKYSAEKAFDGEGARRYGGRWNSRGTPVVYTAQSQSLAVLEMLVHLDNADLLLNYIFYPVTIPDSLIDSVADASLPQEWQYDPALPRLREIGDAWVASGASAVLRVPSSVVPSEYNYLLNPKHGEFGKMKVGSAVGYRFDPRLGERK